MHADFRTLLLGNAGVAAIAGGRVNWGSHPQGEAQPYIVLTSVSDVEAQTLEGPNGLSSTRVQVDCYAMAYKAAVDLARAARTCLSGYRGGVFRNIEYVTTRDGREGGADEADRPFRVSMDFLSHWRAT